MRKRKTITLTGFRGADFSAASLDAATTRATAMRNFLHRDGVNHKRPGWNQLCVIRRDGAPQPINGIFAYTAATPLYIVHAGARFYRVTPAGEVTDVTLSGTTATVNPSLIQSCLSQGFEMNHKLYLVGCGDFLVYGKWQNGAYELRRVVGNEDTAIPTTCLAIRDGAVAVDTRTPYRPANRLCPVRRNRVYGRAFGENEAAISFLLDAPIDANTAVKITLDTFSGNFKVRYEIDNLDRTNQTVAGYPASLQWTTLCKRAVTNFQTATVAETVTTDPDGNQTKERELLTTGESRSLLSPVYCGYFDPTRGQVFLSCPCNPIHAEIENITVEFSHSESAKTAQITSAAFGTLFGIAGNTNRLFLANGNQDFYSEAEDFTYFGENSTCQLGESEGEIAGYARLNDETLAVFKQSDRQNGTVWYRTGSGERVSAASASFTRANFSQTAGTIGRGVASRNAFGNLAGDVLMLSNEGVVGIVLGSNLATAVRYARERSRLIDNVLTSFDLSQAVARVYKNRYYLALPGGEVFVADARYTFRTDPDMDDTFNYEWWRLTDCPIRVFGDGADLIFGSSDGMIAKFCEGSYADRTYEKTAAGDVSVSAGRIVFNPASLTLQNGDAITLEGDNLFALVGEYITESGGRFYASDTSLLHEGRTVYADAVGDSGLQTDTPYTVAEVDRAENSFLLLDENGDPVGITDGETEEETAGAGLRLHMAISGLPLAVTGLEGSGFSVAFSPTGEALPLSVYNETPASNLTLTLCHAKPVVAEWVTPMLDGGLPSTAKTLQELTLTREPSDTGVLKFGYETRRTSHMGQSEGVGNLRFDDTDFTDFCLDKVFATSFTLRLGERNVHYVRLRLRSDDPRDCSLHSLTLTFTPTTPLRGMN